MENKENKELLIEEGQENQDKKKKHTGLKVAGAIAGTVVAGGIAMSVLMPNVTDMIIDKAEEAIYDLTGIHFDVNENIVCGYAPVSMPEFEGQ